jgi:hypothetical protein
MPAPGNWFKQQQMIRFRKDKPMLPLAPKTSPDRLANMTAMTEKLGLATVAAAWPAGVSQLAQAIDACQRCDTGDVCTDWLARAPKSIKLPPEFCPNAPEFKRVKQAKER